MLHCAIPPDSPSAVEFLEELEGGRVLGRFACTREGLRRTDDPSRSYTRASAAASTSTSIWLSLQTVRSLYLPVSFPASVTPDYLEYQLWSLPTHVTGWIAISITTSSLLKAVGIGAGAAGAAATGAAARWLLKDGIGALGRFLVGGVSSRFDEDPKHWRMMAELLSTGGIALEIATLLRPDLFVFLAGGGTLAKVRGCVGGNSGQSSTVRRRPPFHACRPLASRCPARLSGCFRPTSRAFRATATSVTCLQRRRFGR